MNTYRLESRRTAAGLSLIEILIALAIGSLLVLGLVEVFAASRTAYQMSAGLARVQENGRFAMDFLQRDLRMAGHLGCVNDQSRFLPENTSGTRLALASTFVPSATPELYSDVDHYALRFDLGIEGYEANGTGPGDTLNLTTTPAQATGADQWTPAINARIYDDMASSEPVPGSDVVVLRYFSPIGAQVTAFTPAATTSMTLQPAQIQALKDGGVTPGLLGISDCMNAAVFQASNDFTGGTVSVGASGLNKDTLTGNESFVVGQANVYRAEAIVLFVGINAGRNPALYRLRYAAVPGGADLTALPEELVEGVESLQLRYGQDSNTAAGTRPTGNIGTSQVAGALAGPDSETAWRRVGLIQIGLVMRSTEPAAAVQRDEDSDVLLSALGVTIESPNDTYYRTVYEDSIALRNRLFGN